MLKTNMRVILIAAVLAIFSPAALLCQQSEPPAENQPGASSNDPHHAEELAAQRQALGFLGYLDHGRFDDSYAYTGMLIRTQVDRESFASQVEKARDGVGTVVSRELIDSNYTTSVQGAPDGEYVVLHYHTGFSNRQDSVETVTLALAKGYWRVSGYYIR